MRLPPSRSLPDEIDRAQGPAHRREADCYRVPASPACLRQLRAYVDDAAAAFGLGSLDRHGFVVAVNEAATNAIKHGRPYADGAILLSIDRSEDTLICSISDRGPFVCTPAEADSLAERGRGFKLMVRLADQTNVSRGVDGTTVELHMYRRGAPPRQR